MKTYLIRVFGVLGPGRVYKIQAKVESEAYDKAKHEFRQETGELAFRWQVESVT
jgi:hypothetical protein